MAFLLGACANSLNGRGSETSRIETLPLASLSVAETTTAPKSLFKEVGRFELFPLLPISPIIDRREPDQSPAVLRLVAGIAEAEKQETLADSDSGRGPTDAAGALHFRRVQMQDEKGEIPPDGLEKARQQVTLMKAAQRKRLEALRKSGKQPPLGTQAAGIEPNSWTWRGPGNIGGRIRSIVINPTNPNNMWVGSVTGGIWRTFDGGNSWFPVNDFLANLAVSAMAINPSNPSVLYAGTGEGLWPIVGGSNFLDAVQGTGIFRSADSGATWNLLASTNNANFFFVNRLAISPDGNTILAATQTGIWRSTDGGANWSQRTLNLTADVEFRPGDSTRAMLGELGTARFSLDGGQTWTAATFSPVVNNGGRIELATSSGNASIVYAAVTQNNGEIYRSSDGGQSYIRVNTGNNFFSGGAGNQGNYTNALWLNPQDPDTVIVGGVHLWRGRYVQPTLVLTQISDGTDSPHADHHIIVNHPGFNNTTNRIVFFGNDGGIFRADDVATVNDSSGWVERNNTLGITQFYGAAGNAASGVIVGGTQDNGTLRFSGDTEGWTSTFGNDGGYAAADPTDPNFFYGESQYLAVHRSTNGGVSSNNIFAGIADANNSSNTNFAAPLVLDPNNPSTFLAGGISLWRSTDVKNSTPSWTAIKNPLPPNANGNIKISAIAVSPVTSSFILVGHNDGRIFRTLNGTDVSPTWTQISGAPLPSRMVTRLTIDATRATNWIYATFGGFSADNVYRTTDNGTTWVDVTGSGATGLPNVPVRTLVFHPTDPNLLYVGTEIGIFTSEDAGANWEPSQDGPANVSVDELFWMGGDLIAATHGRGVYRASGGIYVDKNSPWPEQLGTSDRPFKTVTQGKNAATVYQPVWIRPGNYNETMTINNINGLELRALGGTVTIGSP